MALWDEVVTRYSAEELVALTNPDDGPQTSVNTARANASVADAQGLFRIIAQAVYDNTDARHVMTAVPGVVAFLIKYGGAAPATGAISLDDYRKALLELRKATTGGRFMPGTDSQLEPTDEFAGTSPVRPDTDRGNWDLWAPTQQPSPLNPADDLGA